jgi:hypothetical protein
MDGQRMLHGELPYRDFFQFTPPGTDLFYFSIFKLFGPHLWVTNIVVLGLGVVLCGLCFSISTQFMKVELALPATILFLPLIYTRLLNATHHWFSICAILCAVRILLQGQSRARLFVAGSLLGLACCFTQSHAAAALAAVISWLTWQYFRERQWPKLLGAISLLLSAFAVTLGAAESYFIAVIGWKQLWYFQVTYVLHFMVHGPETSFLGMPPWNGWKHFPITAQYISVYLLLPIVYAIALGKCWKGSSKTPADEFKKPMLVTLVGSILLCEVMFSLNWLRIYAISMPGIILLLWLIGQTGSVRRMAFRVVWIGVLLVAATELVHAYRWQYVIADLPAGRIAIDPQGYRKLHWIQEHTRPEDFFFDASWPGVYLPLRLRNPVFLDGVGLNIDTRPEFLQRSITQMDEKKVPYILWQQQLNPQGDYDPPGSSLAPLRIYLHQHYKKVKVFEDQDEIWERE